VDLRTDPEHCGRCTRVCPDGFHARPACVDGWCALACESGWWDLDVDVAGCEYECGPTDGSSPPAETCNGRDDDCDGAPDLPGFDCTRSLTVACTTACATAGTRPCGADCRWASPSCEPPAETCNGRDDDCDTTCDEAVGTCCRGRRMPCALPCGAAGFRECGDGCEWGACEPVAAEFCNGRDDDCDGRTDEELWCASHPWPTSADLNGLFVGPDDEAWAVGEGGTIVRWDGAAWTSSPLDSAGTLYDVHGTPDGPDVWAVGESGVVHWDGAVWRTRGLPGTEVPRGVHAVSTDEAWAVGGGGNVWRWNGTDWTGVAALSGVDLLAVWAGEGQVWAVGEFGQMFHSPDGLRWNPVATGTTRDLRFVAGRSADDLWMYGNETALRHWNGVAWTMVEVPGMTGGAAAVHVAADGDVWALDNGGRLHRRRGTVWTLRATVSTALSALGADSTGTVRGVGGAGHLVHCSPAGSCSVVSHVVDGHLMGIHGSGDDDVWTVGIDRNLMHWDGLRWNAVDLGVAGSFYPRDVRVVAADDVWVVAPDPPYVRRRLGGVWSTLPDPSVEQIAALWSSGPNDVWIAGRRGQVARWNGTAWNRWYVDASGEFLDLWGFGPGDVRAVGSHVGLTYHWNGTVWSAVATASPAYLMAVWGASTDDLWAGGAEGSLFRSTGGAWSFVAPVSTDDVNDIWGTAADDLRLVGFAGLIAHWDGTRWAVETVAGPRPDEIRGVWGTPDGTWWAAASSATVLRHRP
jgi:hypothetical protein